MKIKEKIINAYWFLKDRKFADKIGSKPDIYFVYLPFNHGYVFVDLYIKAGALAESKDWAGIGHLLEHYLASQIREKYYNDLELKASINDDYLTFSLAVDKKEKLVERIGWFFNELLKPDFSNEKLFAYERQSIINELIAERQDIEKSFDRLVEKTRYRDEPNGRSFPDHLESLPKLTIEDIAGYYQKTFSQDNLKIWISDTKLDKKIMGLISEKINQANLSNSVSLFPEPNFSNFTIVIEERKDLEGQYAMINFPFIQPLDDYRDRTIISILIEYLIDGDKNAGFNLARKEGIYNFSSVYNIGIKNGYWGIKSYLTGHQLNAWLKIVSLSLAKIKRGEIDQESLEKIKDIRVLNGKNSWRSNDGRFKKISDSFAAFGKVIDWSETERIIKSISVNDLTQMAQKISDYKNANIVIYGQKPASTPREISSVLKN